MLKLARAIFIGLLILAQSAALAHEFEHPTGTESGTCAVCSVSHDLESPALDTSIAPEGPSCLLDAGRTPAGPFILQSLQGHCARAPPATS